MRYRKNLIQKQLNSSFLTPTPTKAVTDGTLETKGSILAYCQAKIDLTASEVLEYRGVRFPIDDQWGDAWFKKKNGEIMHFRLDWDWWIPIDECLDLDNI